VQGAPVQTAAVESSPPEKTASAAGVYSTARYLGSVTGAGVLALVLVQKPSLGEDGRFVWLFSGLALVSVLGVLVNGKLGQGLAGRTPSVPRSSRFEAADNNDKQFKDGLAPNSVRRLS
jgi:hypothetical protein